MVVKDFETKIPSDLPTEWKPFAGLLTSPRVQDFNVYYLTDFATNMKQVRLNPTKVEHIVCYFDSSNPGIIQL